MGYKKIFHNTNQLLKQQLKVIKILITKTSITDSLWSLLNL